MDVLYPRSQAHYEVSEQHSGCHVCVSILTLDFYRTAAASPIHYEEVKASPQC